MINTLMRYPLLAFGKGFERQGEVYGATSVNITAAYDIIIFRGSRNAHQSALTFLGIALRPSDAWFCSTPTALPSGP